MVGKYLMFFQNNTRSNQFNQPKVHYPGLILPIAVSKRCTQDLWISKARVLDFCLPTIPPFQKFFLKEYFISGIVDFGVSFSINFLSFSGFIGV